MRSQISKRVLEQMMRSVTPPPPPPPASSPSTSMTEVSTFVDQWGRRWFAYSTEPWSLYQEDSIVRFDWTEVQDRYGPLLMQAHNVVIQEEP